MFVLFFSGFDTFHAQGKMRMICRTFAIHTLPCYLILNKVMLDLTEEKLCLKGESAMVGTNLDAPVTCCYGAVLCRVALQELTLLYKQLGLGTSPQIWFCIQDFQGSKLLNGCLGLVV